MYYILLFTIIQLSNGTSKHPLGTKFLFDFEIRRCLLIFFCLQNLLTSDPNLASVFSSKDNLLPLFECFYVPVSSGSNIPQLCLSVLSRLTTHAPCLEAMVADGSSVLPLLQCFTLPPVVVKVFSMFFMP